MIEASTAKRYWGWGATFFEEGLTLEDSQSGKRQLEAALADFENALTQSPGSIEALYNKIQALYQLGRHNEAVQRIGEYLSRDRQSVWAKRLRSLQTPISLQRQ